MSKVKILPQQATGNIPPSRLASRLKYVMKATLAVAVATIYVVVNLVSYQMTVLAADNCNEARLRDLGVAIVNCTGDCGVGAQQPAASSDGSVIDRYMQAVASHESGGDPKANSGNGATGKYQNTPDGWRFLQGFYPEAKKYTAAYLAPEEVQDAAEYLSVVGQLKKYNGDLTKVIIDQYYPAANDDLDTWWNKVPGSGNAQTIGEFVTDIINRINKGEGSNIVLKYSEAPGFQEALNAMGGAPTSVTTSKGGTITSGGSSASTSAASSQSSCCATDGTTASATGPASTTASGLSAENVAFLEKYHAIAEKLSIEYGIPWETVMAQGIIESDSGRSEFARERNNFFGIGAFDSNPDNAFRYPTPEAGWKGYFDNIARTATYREHGVFKEPAITDPIAYLKAIKAAGYATDPNYVDKISKVIKSIQELSTKEGWASSAELAKDHPEMLTNAAKYASGDATVASDTDTSASCTTGSSGLSGGIVDIANEMGTWGAKYQACYIYGGGHGMTTAQLDEAINNHFTGSYGIDCSSFVRAVIYKATGKDMGSLATQGMCASDLFDHIPKSQAQPGDIVMACSHHTEVIVAVNGDGTFKTVGSHKTGCGEGYGASPGNFQGEESFVLRFKG